MDKRLFLIDGHALIFKMYYAFLRHPMINSKGEDTSVLFGFTKYLFELIEKEKPTHLAVAFDPPGGTFRNEMYPEYKANRAETPRLIIDALEPLTEICGALRIPVLMIRGYEADDVIGTMAKKAAKEGFTVYMVTPDKDYGQLIEENIYQYKPGKGGGESEIFGVREVCEKYGICTPARVIDMLTICGDSSDNVPGVRGVGEVGASKLIGKYGSVKGIYEHLDELTPKQKEAFEEAAGHIDLSHALVTIKTDVPMEAETAGMSLNEGSDPKIAELFEHYEFGSLKKYIGNIVEKLPAKEVQTLEFEKISTSEACRTARQEGCCAIITEAYGESIFSGIKGITIGLSGKTGNFSATGEAEDFAEILQDAEIVKCGYDLKKQINLLHHHGITLEGHLWDIELMHYLINPEKSHKIETLAKSYLNLDMEAQDAEKQATTLSLFDEVEEVVDRTRDKEAVVSAMLGRRIFEEIGGSAAELYTEIEEPLMRVLAAMEQEGVKVDMNQLRLYAAELSRELDGIRDRVREMAGEPELNILSTKQVGAVIFEKLRLDPKVKAKQDKRYNYSTDEETLSALAHKHPIINEILEYRTVKKLLSTYIEPFHNYVSPQTGKIHTTFNQALTATGRLSSSKPNLQNIPIRTERGKEIRKAFIPAEADGVIMSADYSQIELRIMAHLSGDEHLIQAFREGKDVHAITAAKIFGISPGEVTADQRRIAKTANFGIMYGISAFGLAQRLKISRAEAKKIIEDYFHNFPTISSYIENTIAGVKEKGYAETLFGRRRYLPDINSGNNNVRSLAERNAINAPIQGSSADIIKKAMTGVAARMKAEGLRSRMVLQIHDELVFDAQADEVERLKTLVVEEMENVITLSVPLTVECNYGKNWLDAH